MNERAAERELWDNLFFNPDQIVRFPKAVLDEVPNAYDIVFQFSKDILLEYGRHDSEETVFTIDDICSCLLRLEHYKRQYIPSTRSVPLFFIDEEVVKKLLLVNSPLIVEGRLAAMLHDSPPLFHLIQAQLFAMKDPANKPGPLNSVTNRLSYLSYVQPSFAESELSLLFYFLTKESIDYPGFDSKSNDFYSIQMKGVSSLMRSFYLSKLQDLYTKAGVSSMINPKGKVSRSEFFNLIHAYFATMESKTMIEELKKIERARNDSTAEKNLHSYMKSYNLSAPSSLKNKEEFLKIVEAVASSVQIADAAFFQAMEPLLFRELISSFICRPVAFLQSSHLPEVTNVMRAKKEIYVNRLLQYQSIVRARYFDSALSEYGLTSPQFQHLVSIHAPQTPEIAALLEKWEDCYDPKPSYFKKPSHQSSSFEG